MAAMIRRVVAATLDVVVVALAVLVARIVNLGGFVLEFSDVRVSLRTPSRALFWMVAALVVRLILDRRTPPFALTFRRWPRFLRVSPGSDPFDARPRAGLGWRVTFASLGIALALAILVHDQLQAPYSVADYGDPLFSIWRIGWVLHQIVADPARLFDANIFYSQRLTLTFSDPIILPALTASPLAAIGLHPVVVYNLLLLSGFWFSGIATYLLVERLTASPLAAFAAGLIYACYPYRFEHYGHLELQMTQWMPLGLLALHLFISTGRWRYAIALGLAGAAQLYSSMYYAVFFLLYASVIGAGLLLAHRPSMRRLALPAVGGALVAGLIAVPLARAFVAAEPLKEERTTDEVRFYSATPLDYFRGNLHSALWKDRILPPEPERALFPGVMPLALAAIGAAPPLSAIRLVYTAGLLVALDCSFGFNGAFYPLLHRSFPPVRGLRVPARFSVIVGLTLSIFAGFGVRRILGWCRSRTSQRAVMGALAALIVIDAWPALPMVPVWKEPPSIYETLKGKPDTVLAEFPVDVNEVFNTPYMYFSVWHWVPMVNGYSGYIPESYKMLAPDLLEFPRGDTVRALRRRGVTHVSLTCGLQSGDCNESMNRMRESTALRLVAEDQWEGEPVQLFELTGD
jgi:hypothetical protein